MRRVEIERLTVRTRGLPVEVAEAAVRQLGGLLGRALQDKLGGRGRRALGDLDLGRLSLPASAPTVADALARRIAAVAGPRAGEERK